MYILFGYMDPLGIAKRVQNYGRHGRTPPKASGLKRFIGCIWTKTVGLGPRYWTCRDRSFWGIKGLSKAEFVGVGSRVFVRFGIRKLGYPKGPCTQIVYTLALK